MTTQENHGETSTSASARQNGDNPQQYVVELTPNNTKAQNKRKQQSNTLQLNQVDTFNAIPNMDHTPLKTFITQLQSLLNNFA